MIDQNAINSIFTMYPWASEETASRIADLARSSNIKSSALAVAVAQASNSSDAKSVEKMIKDTINATESAEDKIEAISGKVKGQLDGAIKSLEGSSGLESMAELTHAGAKAMNATADAVADFASGGGAVTQGLSNIATFATGTGVAAASLGVVFSQLVSEQEKTTRAMIDYGLIVGNIDFYTDLRSRVANFAMGVDDYTSILESTKGMMTGITGDAYTGQTKMLTFLDKAIDDESLSRFGYAPQEYAMQLAEEASMLYKLNQVNEMGFDDEKRVHDSFDTANRLSLFLADNVGMQRSQALAARQEARANADLQLVMFQQAEYIQENLGAQASTNILEANDFLHALMKHTLGDELAAQTQQVMAHFIQDIQFDTSAVNNIPTELMETLQRISPNTANEFISIIEDVGQGKVTAEEMIIRYQQFAKEIDQSTAKISQDEIGESATSIRAQVASIPDSFFDITAETMESTLATITDTVGTAGLSVDMVGNIAIGFKKAQNAITPGYESMSSLFGFITGAGEKFGNIWVDFFGLDTSTFATVEERDSAARQAEIENATAIQYHRGGTHNEFFARAQTAQMNIQNQTVLLERLEDEYSDLMDTGDQQLLSVKYDEVIAAQELLEKYQQDLTSALSGEYTYHDSNANFSDEVNDSLLDFIGSGEGSYTASNRGTISGVGIVGSNMDTTRSINGANKRLDEMTFAEIFALQEIDNPNNPNRLFAVGKYQIIPDTMQEIFPHSGLSVTDLFTPENQDILGSLLVLGNEDTGYYKRPELAAFIRGESDNLHAAMLDFAREWASAPDPRKAGNVSVYGSGNRASHTKEEVAAALMEAQARYLASQSIAQPASSGIQTQIDDLQQQIDSGDITNNSELSEMRAEISRLEAQLATEAQQLNSELDSQNATEALP